MNRDCVASETQMILIPAGDFVMGNDEGLGFSRPQHVVFVDDFHIDKSLVTNEMFAEFILRTGYRPEGEWKRFHSRERLQHPAIAVSWNDAMRYAEWAGKTLPTEAQWEKAARGIDGREFPWGNQWDPLKCNCWEYHLNQNKRATTRRSFLGTSVVGEFAHDVSPYGCYDMGGNVSEWVFDEFAPYDTSLLANDEIRNAARVMRGGNWKQDCYITFTCHNRFFAKPERTSSALGFRCAKSTG